MDGILLVDKPKGWTSFDVVNKVRRLIEQSEYNVTNKKRFPVGHTGTLDPLATGLLVLLVGKATRLAPQLSKLDKTYEVTMVLGQTSTTGDEEGQKTAVSNTVPSEKSILEALESLQGHIMQTPPAYSAIKIQGQRAYKLARAGKTVEMKPRPATIHSMALTEYAYPAVKLTAHVSSGTYIRTLVEDIGVKLGTGAYLSDLRRTHVGSHDVRDAIQVSKTTAAEQIFSNLQDPGNGS